MLNRYTEEEKERWKKEKGKSPLDLGAGSRLSL
jgi:hypothetical protein